MSLLIFFGHMFIQDMVWNKTRISILSNEIYSIHNIVSCPHIFIVKQKHELAKFEVAKVKVMTFSIQKVKVQFHVASQCPTDTVHTL